MVRIKSRRHNFRRCGIAHPKESTEYPDDRFTKKELKILMAEPMLTVVEVAEIKDEAKIKAEAKAKAEAEAKAKAEVEEKAKAEEEAEKEQESDVGSRKTEDGDDLLKAAKKAAKAGDVTTDGKPTVEAIEKILGKNISAADRDKAWEKLKVETGD